MARTRKEWEGVVSKSIGTRFVMRPREGGKGSGVSVDGQDEEGVGGRRVKVHWDQVRDEAWKGGKVSEVSGPGLG